MNTIKEIGNGKFELTEIVTYTGGEKKGQNFESKSIIFNSEENANKEAISYLNFMGCNTVFLGLKEKQFESKKYYYPTYNVFD